MNSIDQKLVQDYFDYKDGVLIWKKSTGPRSVIGSAVSSLTSHGYIALKFMGKSYKAHQIIFLWHHGYIPLEIDHINNKRNDNRIENLRETSRKLNCANQSIQKRSLSGYKGVTKLKHLEKWRARIKHDKKEIYLGIFDSAKNAADAYNKKAYELFGSFAKLNNIGDMA